MTHKAIANSNNQNLIAAVIYLLNVISIIGVVASIIFLFIEKKNHFIRFHAAQSLLTFGGLFILSAVFFYIPGMMLLRNLIGVLELVLWVVLMIQAYKGNLYKLPYIGDLAENLLKKIG